MEWLFGPVNAYLVVSSAVLVLWSALFFIYWLYQNKESKRPALWGLSMLVLSLHPLVSVVAQYSIPAACAVFWVSQTAGSLMLLMGLVHDRLGRRQAARCLVAWAAASLVAAAGFVAAWRLDGVEEWLACVCLLQGAVLAVGPALLSWPRRDWRLYPVHAALLLFAAFSVYSGVSLLAAGRVGGYGLLWLLNSIVINHTMCYAVLVQQAASIRGAMARLESLVSNTSQGLAFISEDGILQQMNRRMLEILGVDPLAMGKQPLRASDIGLDIALSKVGECKLDVKLDYDFMAERGLPVLRKGQARLIVTARKENGLGGQRGIFLQVDDMTEQDRTLGLLMENRYRMDLMMQAADAYEYVRDGRTLQAQGWFRALGHGFASIDIFDFVEYVHPQDHAKYPIARATETPEAGITFASEGRFRNAEGNYVWYYVSSRNVVLNDKVITLGMALNIDRHKRMEQHVMQNDRLAAVGQLANGVAHDINNHLMTIQTSLGLLNTVTDEIQRKKYSSYMQEAITNSTGMLKRLVNFSKGDEEGFTPVSMNTLLSQTMELLERALYREAALVYSNNADRDLVMGNYYELQNILLNIGLNARDALPEGDGQISIKAWNGPLNALKPGHAGGWFFISVRDNGCGMSASTQKRIFDPFFTTKPQGRGSGLGLFTSYGSAQRHGGTISVESAEGIGTEFVIALPLAEAEAVNNSQPEPQTAV